MKKYRTLEEMLGGVVQSLNKSRYGYGVHDWFSPNDVRPFSTSFKYQCKKLYEAGLLERGLSCGRWGYYYRVPVESDIELLEEK